MKMLLLIAEAIADEPSEELNGKTPLEVASTPHIDQIAKTGRIGSGLFTKTQFPVAREVACLSLLGIDPAEYYSGLAPLEALAMDITHHPKEIVFCCDFVTVDKNQMVDPKADQIPAQESVQLLETLNRELADTKMRFYPGVGHRNILVISDPQIADTLNEVECIPPLHIRGHKITQNLPKGKGADQLIELMEKASKILENHEINRVRIDLKENPANRIWLWGQGKTPSLPDLRERYGLTNPVFVSKARFAQGLAKSLGFPLEKDLPTAVQNHDLVFFYMEAPPESKNSFDVRAKIRFIEKFDTQVGEALKQIQGGESYRLLISTDYATSSHRKAFFHGHTPFLIAGTGIEAQNGEGFDEKTAAQSSYNYDEGHEVFEDLLKSSS